MTLRLPDDVDAALREQARRDGLSLNEAVIKAVSDYASQRTRRRDEYIREIAEHDREILRRLGEGA